MIETPTQYTQRIRQYVDGREPIAVQAATAARLEQLIAGVSTANLRKRPAPDRWSVSEIAAHLADAEIVISYRLRLTSTGPLVLQGDKGFSQKSEQGQASYYYSQPFFQADGTLEIDDYVFTAQRVQVPVGTTLTWHNNGATTHTATASNGAWDTGDIAPGASQSLTFDTPGTYSYSCTPHPWMLGQVIVQ